MRFLTWHLLKESGEDKSEQMHSWLYLIKGAGRFGEFEVKLGGDRMDILRGQAEDDCWWELGVKLVWSIDGTTRRGRLDEGKRMRELGALCTYPPFLPHKTVGKIRPMFTLIQGAPVTQNNMTRNILRGNIHFQNFLWYTSWSQSIDTVLPLFVFGTLTYYACKFIFGNLLVSGLASIVTAECKSEQGPYSLPYTGIPLVDKRLCGLVAFFHGAMTSGDPFIHLNYFFTTGSIFYIIPAVEGFRIGRRMGIVFPAVVGLLGQVCSIGATMPLYYLVFFLSGGRARFDSATSITKVHAQAILFGLIVGAGIPSIYMVILQNPISTAIWQPFPIYMAVATFLYLTIKRPGHAESGFDVIQFFYFVSLIGASLFYLVELWFRWSDLEALKALYIPSITPLVGAPTPVQVHDFLKWDLTFALLSTGIAQLWFVSDVIEIPLILLWYLIAIPLLGPGAAVIAVNMWREGQIGDHFVMVKEKEKEI